MNRRGLLIGLVTALAILPFVAPEALAFPYREDFGADRVWSVRPIERARMQAILDDARHLTAASPIAAPEEGRRIFLTDGGWRWAILALQARGGFGLTRAIREDVILNRSDLATGKIYNGARMGGTRSLAGVIAHEKCHGMERRHFGLIKSVLAPQWLLEGYCDHVAQESSLTDADVAALTARGESHPALPYYQGRRRVAEILAGNGGNVDALFADPR